MQEELDSMPLNTLGDKVKKLRIEKGLNRKEFSIFAKTTPTTLKAIEDNINTDPLISIINNLSIALEVPLSYLKDLSLMPEDTTSQIIKKYRLVSGMSTRELGERCGLAPVTITDYEKGRLSGKRATNTLVKIYKEIGYKK